MSHTVTSNADLSSDVRGRRKKKKKRKKKKEKSMSIYVKQPSPSVFQHLENRSAPH